MKHSFKWILFLLMGVLFLFACQEEAPVEEIIRPVKALKVADADTFEGIKYNGIAQATRQVDLSFRVDGPMISRLVNVGDAVKKDQLVARIDPRDYEVRLRTAKGQLTNAIAVRKRAQSDLDRLLRIQKKDPGAVSQILIDKALQNRDSAQAEIRSLEAAVDGRKDDLAYTYLKAPFDGIITKRYVEAFEDVRRKQPVVRLLDPSKIEMWVNVPETLISLEPYVDKVWVRFDALNLEVPAEIKEVGTEASQTTRTFPVNLIMEQPKDAEILPGMAGVARYTLNMPEGIQEPEFLIPVTAVFTDPEKQKNYVWLIDESANTVNRHEIAPGKLTGRGLTVKGLQPGQWIAVAGVDLLREGQKIKILEPGKLM
ncbi:MAG: efflux RND transporter periplasmic adaptor subunit [Desulfobacterales bacterium]|nr:efflux RND transporter periplasmic adaptor subunit [Desulfobacterales bacterium]